MTDPTTKFPPPDTDTASPPARPEPPKVSLSLTQVLASVLAAVSASVAASVFGVAGTVIGAGLGSAISVVGGAVYARSLERSRQAARLALAVATARRLGVRGSGQPGDQDPPGQPGDQDPPGRPPGRGRRLRLALTPQRLALGAGALFLLTMALITGFELLTGQPVAASVDGRPGSGVSVLGGTERSGPGTTPAPSGVGSTAATSTAATSTAPSSAVPSSAAPGTASPSGSTGQPGQPGPTVTVTVTPTPTPSAGEPSGSAAPVGPTTGNPTRTSGG